MTPEAIRALFPGLSGRIYLNAASEGPMPAGAVREAERVARLKETPWEIGTEYYYRVPAEVRSRLEAILGAPGGSVGLVPGTSAGIGLAAQRLPLGSGDEVLLLESQFPSNVFPWYSVRGRGATIRVVERPLGSDPTTALLSAIGPATRAISVDWVNFVDGAVVDLAVIGEACRGRGIFFIVDAAQGLGALRIDAGGLPDILAAPSHKWLLGPVGLGLVYVSPRLLPVLQNWNSGWVNLAASSGFRNLLHIDGMPPEDATRFETGSPPYSLLAPWTISLDLLAEIGGELVQERVLSLAARAAEGVLSLAPAQGSHRGLSLLTPHLGPVQIPAPAPAPNPAPTPISASTPALRQAPILASAPRMAVASGIISFTAGERTLGLYHHLESKQITVAFREGAIRLSPHIYNSVEEIDSLLSTCRSFLG